MRIAAKIDDAVYKAVQKYSNREAKLNVKGFLAAEQARIISIQTLRYIFTLGQEGLGDLPHIIEDSQNLAWANLKHHLGEDQQPSTIMAIVKVKYTRSRPKIKAHVRYITHRPGREGEKISRPFLTFNGLIDKDQAYRLIDEATRGRVFFKVILSPDPKREDQIQRPGFTAHNPQNHPPVASTAWEASAVFCNHPRRPRPTPACARHLDHAGEVIKRGF